MFLRCSEVSVKSQPPCSYKRGSVKKTCVLQNTKCGINGFQQDAASRKKITNIKSFFNTTILREILCFVWLFT